MQIQLSKTSGNRNRVSGFLRLFVFSLLTAVFACTTLSAQTVAYVTNLNSNSVSVIDISTNTVTATIPVGAGPAGVVFSPAGTTAYVSNANAGTVSVIDTASNTVTATIVLPKGAFGGYPAITPDGKTLYVPDDNNSVAVIDTASNSVITAIPAGLAPIAAVVTPDGRHVYVNSVQGIMIIDTSTNTVVGPLIPGIGESVFRPCLAITPDGSQIYFTAADGSSRVFVISTASNTRIATLSVPSGPVGIAVTPDGSSAFVTKEQGNAVGIIDTATNTVEATSIPVGAIPTAVAVTPDGAFVYVVNLVTFSGNGTVSVISTATNAVVATVPVGSVPDGIAMANMSTPFSNLTIKGLTVNQNGFAENGSFSLGAGSTGIDLAHQPFTVIVDGFSLTIPGGSFKQVGGNMHFVFNGTINGAPVSVNLIATGGTSTDFKFSLSVTGVDLTGQPNPATVGLNIGSNTGSTTAPF
jgi:YVTN family beta-propeller protein